MSNSDDEELRKAKEQLEQAVKDRQPEAGRAWGNPQPKWDTAGAMIVATPLPYVEIGKAMQAMADAGVQFTVEINVDGRS